MYIYIYIYIYIERERDRERERERERERMKEGGVRRPPASRSRFRFWCVFETDRREWGPFA